MMPNSHTPPPNRFLVTGAAGFIGSHLCRMLAADGKQVVAVSRSAQADHRAPADRELNWRQCDLTDPAATQELIRSAHPQAIIHLAGVTSAARELSMVGPTFAANTVATVNVLSAATALCVGRVVLAGSLEEPRQQHDAVVSSPYAASKIAATTYARMFHQTFGLNVTVARIFMVYGPGQRELRKLVPYVTLSLLSGRTPRLSSGERLVDWVYVEDVARGLMLLAGTAAAAGEVVDLGTGVLTRVGDVARKLHDIIGGDVAPEFGQVPDRPLEQVAAADVAVTHRLLGGAPTTPLDDGLRRTVQWYREQLECGRIVMDAV